VRILFACVLLAACGAPEPSASSSPGDSGVDAGFVPLAPPTTGIQLHYGPRDAADPADVATYTLSPGDETVRCEVIVDAHPAYHVAAYETLERAGMHHFSLFTGTTGAPPAKDMCTLATTPLFLVQTIHEWTEFSRGAPELTGAALTVNAGSFVAQAHAINLTDAPMLVEAWTNFETVDATPVPVTYLGLSAGHTMAIPPHTKQTITAIATDMNAGPVLQIAGHMHAHGVELRASFEGKEVYRTDNWAEPDVKWFSSVDAPPFTIPMKGHLSWECDIDNTTDAVIKFANQVQTAEMCNLVGFVLGMKPFAQSLP
jgi:hypothetical protein